MLIGAHLDNLDEPTEESYRRLQTMRAQIVGTLWTDGTHHRRPVYDCIEEILDKPTYCVRVGPSGRLVARAWARQAQAALAELPPSAIDEGRVRIRALNEVNLPVEGDWRPDEYADFLRAARRAARLPRTVALVSAPISLGRPDFSDWWERFVAASDGLIPATRIAVNCYAHLVPQAAYFADYGRPVDVTELNTLQLPPGPARAAWLLDRCRDLAAAGVESVQIFIIGGRSNGAWDDRYILTDEEAEALGRRPDPSGAPPPKCAEGAPGDRGISIAVPTTDAAEPPVVPAPAEIPRSARHDIEAGGGDTPATDDVAPTVAPTDPALSASPLPAPPLTGLGMFIWYVAGAENGDPDAILARAHAAGLRYVLIKCGDGAQSWQQFTPELVATLKAGGLGVFGWAYCYGEDVDGELAVAAACLAAGADGYLADVEAEYEGRWREAERFAAGLAELRAAHGGLIGYSPLPVIDYHQSLPYVQLNRVADVVLPQLYCRALGAGWGPDALWEQWRRWSDLWRGWDVPVPRIVPVGEAFGDATAADLTALAAASRANATPDLCFWEWAQARDEHWAVIAELAGALVGAQGERVS